MFEIFLETYHFVAYACVYTPVYTYVYMLLMKDSEVTTNPFIHPFTKCVLGPTVLRLLMTVGI